MIERLYLQRPADFMGQESPFYTYGDHRIRLASEERLNKNNNIFENVCMVACCKCGCMIKMADWDRDGEEIRNMMVPAMDEFKKTFPSSCKEAENCAEVHMIMTS